MLSGFATGVKKTLGIGGDPSGTAEKIEPDAGSYRISRALFLRLLGLVYLAAFASLWVQLEGLVGAEGILPAGEFLARVQERLGEAAWWRLPTLCWLDAGNGMLLALCGGGVGLALLLIAGVAPAAVLALLWLCYLSLVGVGQEFLSFQWDALLLESGFLALWWAPLALRPQVIWGSEPPRWPGWLLRGLLFRLLIASGAVKLLSGDSSWAALQALAYHYQTQPLPSWTSWYAHQLPPAIHTGCTALLFFIELVAPFALFAGWRWRQWGLGLQVGLQLAIALTGNFGFFNLLTIALCVPFVDDQRWRRLRALVPGRASREWPRWLVGPVAALLAALSFLQFAASMGFHPTWPGPVRRVEAYCRPFMLANSYGLFAVMTTHRFEIEVEGSADGRTWQAYGFRWKPGDLGRRPAFVAPHMPRLDWQMWFAALSAYQRQPWIADLLLRLLQGKPAVLGLFQDNPFPEVPPRFVRARLYEYQFATPAQREQGQWWQREERGDYTPVFSLRE